VGTVIDKYILSNHPTRGFQEGRSPEITQGRFGGTWSLHSKSPPLLVRRGVLDTKELTFNSIEYLKLVTVKTLRMKTKKSNS